eukprot:sb/3464554/
MLWVAGPRLILYRKFTNPNTDWHHFPTAKAQREMSLCFPGRGRLCEELTPVDTNIDQPALDIHASRKKRAHTSCIPDQITRKTLSKAKRYLVPDSYREFPSFTWLGRELDSLERLRRYALHSPNRSTTTTTTTGVQDIPFVIRREKKDKGEFGVCGLAFAVWHTLQGRAHEGIAAHSKFAVCALFFVRAIIFQNRDPIPTKFDFVKSKFRRIRFLRNFVFCLNKSLGTCVVYQEWWIVKPLLLCPSLILSVCQHNTHGTPRTFALPFTQDLQTYYTPEGLKIEPKHCVRDLGVQLSDDLSWEHQIGKMTSDARKISAWVLRAFKTREEKTMTILYKSLVRSKLEYCCPLWDSPKISDIQNVEAIQRKFTKRIKGMADLNYWERLKKLKITSLQRRRERYSIIMIGKPTVVQSTSGEMDVENPGSPTGTRIHKTKQQFNLGLDTDSFQGGGGSVRN